MTHTSTEQELLPCPFCGGDAVHFLYSGSACVGCKVCIAYLGGEESDLKPDELADAWNRRAPAPQAQHMPLSDEAVKELIANTYVSVSPMDGLAIARAIEAAHGITQEKQGWKLVPVELLERATESLGSFVSDHGWEQADMDTFDDLSALAAAPQPPDAAPVQMPEPWAISHHNCVQYSNAAWHGETPDGTKLYTEQQVRQLLADQAKEKT